MTEWRPIESAPRDGTKIDIGELNQWGWERVADAKWDDRREFWVHWGLTTFDRMDFTSVDIIPTHWMPLPEPPK